MLRYRVASQDPMCDRKGKLLSSLLANMIKKIKETLSQVFFSPEATGSWDGDDITVNMDGGVGGSWTVNDEEDGLDYEDQYYTGVPAPAYLEIDPWFSPPVLSEKQMTYKEAYDATAADQQIADGNSWSRTF